MPNPADTRTSDQAALVGIAAAFFLGIRRTSPLSIQTAIRTGSILPITQAPIWQAAHQTAVASATPVHTGLAAFGMRSGYREVPGTRLVRDVPGLAPGIGEERAIRLIQAVDFRSRQAITVMVRTAARQYRRNPSPELLRQLAADIKPLIGLTPFQRSQIKKKIRALQSAGLRPDVVKAQAVPQIDALLDRRAAAIGERAVLEDVADARLRAWLLADRAGEIPSGSGKRARNPLDGRERSPHRALTQIGPIPLRALFPIFRALGPPWPGQGG